jgi:RimJ/RimL family protein N-acetyltransferase
MITKGKIGLRAVEKSDLTQLKEWRNNPDFRRHFREIRELNDVNQEHWFENLNRDSNSYFFSIVSLETGKMIGAGGLLYINWIIKSADFSFYIGDTNEYVSNSERCIDAISGLLEYGFGTLGLNKVWMELFENDERKLKLFKDSFNFAIDGVLRDNWFENGYQNSFLLTLLQSEYNG